MAFHDIFNHGRKFAAFSTVYDIGFIVSDHGHVGRNGQNIHAINLAEFFFLGFGGTSHTGQFLIHAEIILKGDRSQGLGFFFDFNPFLGLYGLMQAVTVAPAKH